MANRALFTGGPCDGTERNLSTGEVRIGKASCQGVVYTLTRTNVPGLFTATAPASAGGGGTLEQFAPDLWAGWQDLRRSIVKRLRPAVTQAQRNNYLALKAANRALKVKGRR